MKNFFKKIGIFLGGGIFASILAAQADQTILYLYYDGGKTGEKSQVLGVGRFLKARLPEDAMQIEFDAQDKEAFLADVQKNLSQENSKNKGIIVTAEAAGLDVVRQLKPQANTVIAHSSHQFTKEHADLKNKADIAALPKYVVTDAVISAIESPYTTLIQTAGVPHNLSRKTIKIAYDNNKALVPVAKAYIGIILGGDAETPEGQLRYYTAKEARELARYIAPQAKEKQAVLLILNGPRTGKHDPETGKLIKTSHRDGSIDAVTKAFMESLQEQGLIPNKDFILFDFQFEKPSAYPVVLGALLAANSPIFVAGESTSMISETADCLPDGLVTAYVNTAMNENHIKHCASEQKAGRINLLTQSDGKWQLVLKEKESSDPQDRGPASEIIADSIMKRLEEKTNGKTKGSATA